MKPKKLLSLILAMVMTISLLPTFTLTVSAETYPTIKKQREWYNGTTYKEDIYTIKIVDEYTVTGDETESWDASENGDKSVMCYINGTELTIAGNGSGKIFANADSMNMFNGFSAVTEITGLGILDTSNATNMSFMFCNCYALTSLDLSSFDTSKVTDMSYMFSNCNSLGSLNLNGFNTSKVTDMNRMFYECSSLTSLDLSSFNTSIVRRLDYMFYKCSALTNLNLSGFNTSNVLKMDYMFNECSSLTSLDLSGFNTSNVDNTSYMFYDCKALTELELSGWDTSNVTIMWYMFYNCSSLKTIYATDTFVTTGASLHTNMFTNCSALVGGNGTTYDSSKVDGEYARIDTADNSGYFTKKADTLVIKPSNSWCANDAVKFNIRAINIVDSYTPTGDETEAWDASARGDKSVMCYINGNELTIAGNGSGKIYANANSSKMFYGFYFVTKITGLDILDTSNVTDMSKMFYCCNALTSLDLSSFDTSNVTSMECMFYDCSSLASLDLSGFDTSSVTDMSRMFDFCTVLTSLDLSGFDTSNVEYMIYMFADCSALTSLDLSSFDTSKVTGMDNMFYICYNLKTIYVSDTFVTTNVESGMDMFYRCSSLVGVSGTTYDESCVDKTCARVDKAGSPGYFTQYAKIKANNSWYASSTDKGSITAINIVDKYTPTGSETESWDASVDDDGFVMCYINGTELTVAGNGSGKIFANEDSVKMFLNFSGVTEINGLNLLDTSNVTRMHNMFSGCEALTTLDLSSFDTSKVTSMTYMFNGCKGLTSLNVSSFDTSKVTDMSDMFNGCGSLTSLDVSGFDTSSVNYMGSMFMDCEKLTSIDVSNFNTSNVKSVAYMFGNCKALTTLDISSFSVSSLQIANGMFYACKNLETIYASDTSAMNNIESKNGTVMFTDCLKLVGGNGTAFQAKCDGNEYARVDKDGAVGYFTKKSLSIGDFKFTAPDNLTYDGEVKTARVVSDTRGIGGITIKYCDEKGNETQPMNVGTYTVKIDVAEGNEYLSAADLTDVSWTFTVNAKSIDGAAVGKFEEMLYNGSEQTPSADVTIDGLTVTGVWSNVKNVSDKTAFTANGNFVGTISDVTPNMAKFPVVIGWSDTESLVYDGNSKTITATVINTYENDVVNLTFGGDDLTQTDRGTYTTSVTAVDNNNYTIVDGQNLVKEWAIAQATDNEITGFSADGWTYGDVGNAPTATAKYGTPTYTYADAIDGAYTENVPTDAGMYWVKATVVGTKNYTEALSEPISFVIGQAVPTENKTTTARVRVGGTLASATVTNGEITGVDGAVLEGTFAWSDDTTEVISADCTKQMTFTPSNKNYTAITIDVAVNAYLSTGIVVNSYPEIESGSLTGNIECSFQNAESDVMSGIVYTALYNTDGRLLSVVMSDVTMFDANTATAFSVPVAWSGLNETGCQVKIFAWDSNLYPLAECVAIELD